MGARFLLDTNIVIYYLDNKLPVDSLLFLDEQIGQVSNLSVITRIELLGWLAPTLETTRQTALFVEQSVIFPLDEPIIQRTISLRRTYRIKLPDAIIAATALTHDLTLVSRNDGDFRKIASLPYWNPFIESVPR